MQGYVDNARIPRRDPHPLSASSQWNEIAGDQVGTVLIDDYNDPVVREFVEKRDQSVHETDTLIREQYPSILESLRTGIEDGISQGYVPDYVMDRWGAIKTLTSLQVVDSALAEDEFTKGNYSSHDDHVEVYHDVTQAHPSGLAHYHKARAPAQSVWRVIQQN